MNEAEMSGNEVNMQKLFQDFKIVLQDAEALAKVTAGDLGEKVHEARVRLAASLDSAKDSYRKVEERAIEGAKATDKIIRAHPYESVGVAFSIGLLLGVLVSRR